MEPFKPNLTIGGVVTLFAFVGLMFVTRAIFGAENFGIAIWTLPVVITVLIVVGLLAWFAWERRAAAKGDRLEAAGLCAKCGYDVRSAGDRCPECGMPIWRPRDPLTGKIIPRQHEGGPRKN